MILYQGLLRSPASWARVGRGYLGELLHLGIDVCAVATRGFRYDERFPLPPGLVEYTPREARREFESAVGLGFLHPPHIERLIGTPRLNLFVWEADRVPPTWIDALERGVDTVLVPSTFAREAMVSSGFPEERVVRVPYGYDHRTLKSAAAVVDRVESAGGGPFMFLAVVAPHRRKGVEELCRAYRQAFTKSDDVLLRVKTTYDPGSAGRRFAFEIPSWDSLLGATGLKSDDAPPVVVDVCTLDDGEMLDQYASAHVVVQPSSGESFGLASLEGAALGRAVVATDWGGHCDFLPAGPDRIGYRLERASDQLYEPVPEACVAMIDIDALAGRLRWHYDHPTESLQVGQTLRAHVAEWTWEAATHSLLDALTG